MLSPEIQNATAQFLIDWRVFRVEATLFDQFVNSTLVGETMSEEYRTEWVELATSMNASFKKEGVDVTWKRSDFFEAAYDAVSTKNSANSEVKYNFETEYAGKPTGIYTLNKVSVDWVIKRAFVIFKNGATEFKVKMEISDSGVEQTNVVKEEPVVRTRTRKVETVEISAVEPVSFDYRSQKLRDKNFNPKFFIPWKTGKGIDNFLSRKGGLMPGTVNIFTGLAGSGKTTVLNDVLVSLHQNYSNTEDFSMSCISSEMTSNDMYEEMEKYPAIADIDFIFPVEFQDVPVSYIIEQELEKGHSIVMLDSYQDICDKIVAQGGVQVGNYIAKTVKSVGKWLTAKMLKAASEKGTAFMVIQQVNKSGEYKGDTSLVHMATSLTSIKREGGRRYLFSLKNRRNGGAEETPMFFYRNDDGSLRYDEIEFARTLEFVELNSKTEKLVSESMEKMNTEFFEQFGLNSNSTLRLKDILTESMEIGNEGKEVEEDGLPFDNINSERVVL